MSEKVEEGNSFRTSFVLGFHGCDAKICGAILTGRETHLRPSENRYDWLGTGIYFWEGSPARAVDYAVESGLRPSHSQGKIRKPAVIGAVLDLGHCLDLLDSQYFDLVRAAYHTIAETSQRHGIPMPTNRPLGGSGENILRDLDCKVINTIHENREEAGLRPFDSVRAAFTEGLPLYEGAGFHDKNHIQICIRNKRCIKGYFRPIL